MTRRLLCLLALGAACRSGGAPAGTISPAQTGTTSAALSDANVAAIVLAANNADILYGTLAAGKSSNPAVRRFAETTVRDHNAVNQAATELAGRLGLTPEDNAASFDLRDNAEEKRGQLRELQGQAFDIAYTENEVAYHTKLLSTIDEVLLPATQNAELKALLVSVRPAVVAHLEHARQLLASLRQ